MSEQKSTLEDLTKSSLRDHFLIAMPGLHDPNFAHSLIYLCEHSRDGSMGLVVNRPLEIPLQKVFDQLELTLQNSEVGERPLFSGGPVGLERGFVLHATSDQRWESTLRVSDEISMTASRDILVDIAAGHGPDQAMVVLGYAGWDAGQLEQEIAENAWLTVPADSAIIFDTPAELRSQAAAATLGIDINLISSSLGHA